MLDLVHEFLIQLMFAAEFNEFTSLGFQAFEAQATYSDPVFPMVAPAEHFREIIIQILDAFLIMGGDLLESLFVPRVLLSELVEAGQGGVCQLETGIALRPALVALLDA